MKAVLFSVSTTQWKYHNYTICCCASCDCEQLHMISCWSSDATFVNKSFIGITCVNSTYARACSAFFQPQLIKRFSTEPLTNCHSHVMSDIIADRFAVPSHPHITASCLCRSRPRTKVATARVHPFNLSLSSAFRIRSVQTRLPSCFELCHSALFCCVWMLWFGVWAERLQCSCDRTASRMPYHALAAASRSHI